MEMIGCLIYISNSCRPETAALVSVLASFMEKPDRSHHEFAARVIIWLHKTKDMGLVHRRSGKDASTDSSALADVRLVTHFDSDFKGCKDTRRSRCGVLCCHGKSLVLWASKRMKIVTWSTFESETAAGAVAVRKTLHSRKVQLLITGKKEHQVAIPIMHGDNEKCIEVAHSGNYSAKTSHMELRFHGLSERVLMKDIELKHVKRDSNPSDLLTHIDSPNDDWQRHPSAIVD